MPDESWDSLRSRIDGHHTEVQAALVEFLTQDLELASILLQFLDPHFGPISEKHSKSIVSKIHSVLDVVRRLEHRIENVESRQRLQQRADGLDFELSLLGF